VPVDEHDLGVQKSILKQFKEHPEYRERFSTLYKLYLNGGTPWKPGDRFHPPIGKVLERIAAEGPDGFYRGPVGQAIASEMQKGGGLITREDLASVKPMVRKPLSTSWSGGTLFTMPPPSSGGIALLETLNILAAAEAKSGVSESARPAHNSPQYLHFLAESFKHAFADRAEFLGDADFVKVPVARLTDAKYAAKLADRVDPHHTLPAKEYGRFILPDDSGTTHFSIIDANGNAVACTETVNTGYGSFVVEPEFGIILNNEMEDFTAHPGVPNVFGLIQSPNNAVEPGKRPLSSMTPSILVRDGKACFVAGASGGPRIITATTQVLLNMVRFGMSPVQAVNAPRIHHQWMPEELLVEKTMPGDISGSLEKRGHKTKPTNESAVVQAASRSADGLRAASDPRKHGRPAGY
jgi:gamma-glutamyltranspeptidase / glutathione hydrolase